jgi:hypothetical protein
MYVVCGTVQRSKPMSHKLYKLQAYVNQPKVSDAPILFPFVRIFIHVGTY